MKLQEIQFKNPVKILQVYKNSYTYGKDQKSFNERKEKADWHPFHSKSGYIKDAVLYLPESIIANDSFTNCNLITIEDENKNPEFNTGTETVRNQCFQQAHSIKLHIFRIVNEVELEVFLDWGYFEVGTPERENHKIGVLKKEEHLAIKINGKTDASLSSRRARVFKEQHYMLQYAGEFTSCLILKEPFEPVVKAAPTNTKVVDLLKPLW